MVRSHQELATRVKGKKICVFLITANEVGPPFHNERNLRPHSSGRNLNERRVIFTFAARYEVCSTVRTETVLIEKARVDVCRLLDRHILQIKQPNIFTVCNQTKRFGVRTKIYCRRLELFDERAS